MAKKPGLNCSFCKKHLTEVKKIVAGPNVYICNECIALCADIAAGDGCGQPEIPTLVMWEVFRNRPVFKEILARKLIDALPEGATVADLFTFVDGMQNPKETLEMLEALRRDIARLDEELRERAVARDRAREQEANLVRTVAAAVIPSPEATPSTMTKPHNPPGGLPD